MTHRNESKESFNIAEFDSQPAIWEKAAYLGTRIKMMIPAMPKLIQKYGIQLEGAWWESRYKSKIFQAQ